MTLLHIDNNESSTKAINENDNNESSIKPLNENSMKGEVGE